jgi:YVTN family beta-propeller protein
MKNLFLMLTAFLGLATIGCMQSQQVGEQEDGSVLSPTRQLLRPAGKSLMVEGRPLDLALSKDGKLLYVKDNRGLIVVDIGTWTVMQELKSDSGSSMHGLLLNAKGDKLYFSGSHSTVLEGDIEKGGTVKWGRTLTMPKPKMGGDAYPCGLALSQDNSELYVCLSRSNSVAIVNLKTTKVQEIAVGMSPYDVVLNPRTNRLYVSNWGGHRPRLGKKTAPSAGSEVEVDDRTIGSSGTVSCVDLAQQKEIGQVDVGLQPTDLEITSDGKTVYVANTNSDTVSVIDGSTFKARRSISVRPNAKLPYGSAPNAISLSKDQKTLFVANGGNNAIGLLNLPSRKMLGWIPTAWYPGAVVSDGSHLFIANIKGWGSRGKPNLDGGRSVYSFSGTLGKVAMPNTQQLAAMTKQVLADALIPESLKAYERSSTKQKALPVPANAGDPSTITHVFYIIKENRTYDQMLGDMTQADGDPNLCMFPQKVTPNHHALAEQFVLLDNYYCNCVNSADGHAWSTEGEASVYLERSFGGWTRSYPYGDDPLTPCSSGFIWDNVLGHELTFRNFGEFNYAEPEKGRGFKDIYSDFKAGKAQKFSLVNGVERLREFSNPDYPGWNMNIPDVLRASIFIKELKAAKTWPNFTIFTLPQDHNSGSSPGMPTPRAHTADNDLALGQIVEAISESPFWKTSVIFVIEDDPQNGVDHIDGHRSLCLVIGPYVRRGVVISEFYNQSSVLHTMERIMGIPPMNQMDASGRIMSACFSSQPNYATYKALPNQIPLDEFNPSPSALKGRALYLALQSAKQNWDKPDRVNDDIMNQASWMATKGPNIPYPNEYAGPHGRGLAKKGLKLDFSALVSGDDD